MFSIRIYFDASHEENIKKLMKLLKISDTSIREKFDEKYLYVKEPYHFFQFREDFMPDLFLEKINEFATAVTIHESAVTTGGGDKYFKIGENQVSKNICDLLMKGKNLKSMLKLYRYFFDHNGNFAAIKKAYSEEDRLRQETKKIAGINYSLIQDNKRVKSLETENEVLKLKRKLYEDKFNELKGFIKNSFWSFLLPKAKELTLEEASFEWPKEITFPHNVAK